MTFFATLLLIAAAVLATMPDDVSAQEKPRFNTSKYDRSVSHRQNLCHRVPDKSILGTGNSIRHALSGVDLNVLLIDYTGLDEEYLFSLNSDGELRRDYPGLFAVLLDELSHRAGFKWRDSYGVAPALGAADGNKTWTDILEWSVDTYDLSQDYWSKTPERIDLGVAYPEGWYDSSIILVDRDKSRSSSQGFAAFNFLQPFELGIWFLIGGAIVFTGLLYWLLEVMDSHTDSRNIRLDPGGSVFLSAVVFTSHFEFRPNTHAARLLAWSWTFWAVIVGSAYTANLASFLIVRNAPSVGMQRIEHAVQREMPMCVQRGSAQDAYVKKNNPKANLVHYESEEETFRGLLKGECQVVLTIMSTFRRYERLSDVNSHCELRWTGAVVKKVNAGFATVVDADAKCTSLVSHVVDLHMLEMIEDGTLNRAWEEYYSWATDQTCSAKEPDDEGSSDLSDSARLGMKELGGIFLFHAILCAISVLIATFQYFQRKRSSSKSHAGLDNTGRDEDVFEDNDAGINGDNSEKGRKRSLIQSIWNKEPSQDFWNSGQTETRQRQSMWETPQHQTAQSLPPSLRSTRSRRQYLDAMMEPEVRNEEMPAKQVLQPVEEAKESEVEHATNAHK